MNKIYSTFICHQNNTRTGEFTIFKNKLVLALTKKFQEENLLEIIKEEKTFIKLNKLKKYLLKKLRINYSLTYLECLKMINRKTDTSGKKNLIFTTSKGLLTLEELQNFKIGGTPLFMIKYL